MHQAFTTLHRDLVLDERRAAVDADAVAVDDVLAGFMGKAGAHVVAQLAVTEHAVLEEVVVLDVGMIERDHTVEVAVLPA